MIASRLESLSFEIYNEGGVKYSALFELDGSTFSNPVYYFSFYPENKDIVNKDENLSNSITKLLLNFCTIAPFPIFFVCDANGGQQAARSRLFDRWFRKNNTMGLEKHNFSFQNDRIPEYISFIARPDDIHLLEILDTIADHQ